MPVIMMKASKRFQYGGATRAKDDVFPVANARDARLLRAIGSAADHEEPKKREPKHEAEDKAEHKAEVKTQAKAEPKAEAKVEAKAEDKSEDKRGYKRRDMESEE